MTNYVENPQAKSNTRVMFRDSFQKNSLMTLLSFISRYGVDRPYLGRACLFLLGSLTEFPFSLYEDLVYGSRIEATQLSEDLVFVIGHWRSGTTHLHNILSQDPQWATPTHMHVFYSRTFFTFERFRAFFASRLPKERGYDRVKVGLDVPEEEEEALLSYSSRSFYHAVIFPRIADEFFRRYALLEDMNPEELVAWQQDYIWFLKKISLAFNGRPLLLKNPVNTCRIAALTQLFPQARFVHIYRNPYEVFESNIKMIQIHTQNMRLQKLFPLEELQKGILQRYILMMQAYERQSQALPSDRLVEVSFEQVRDRPLEALQHIYTQLNLPRFTNALPYFEQYINSQKSYKQNTYRYTKENLHSVQQAWGTHKFNFFSGRSRAFNGVSVLLAMDSVLERERENRIRARLMEEAIESINSMRRDEFAAAVYEYQQELLTSALLAEEAEIARRQQFKNVPFKIVSGSRNIIFTQI